LGTNMKYVHNFDVDFFKNYVWNERNASVFRVVRPVVLLH
jgi:hypothetical protein